jgi:uncharacterized repeat protein (TIGR01451 family)
MAYIKNVGGNMFVEVKGNDLTIAGKYHEKSGTIFQQGSKSLEINSSHNIYSHGHGEKEEPKNQRDKNALVDIGIDIFINEDGKEIGSVKKQGIKGNDPQIGSDNVADLTLQISIDNNTPEIGKVVKFTFVATNNGPGPATRVKVKDVLPSGYSFNCFETDKGTWEAPFWDIGDFANGEKATLLIEATVAEGEYNNSAKIESYQQDSTPANDTSSLVNRLFLIKTIKKDFDSEAPPAGITKQERKETEQFIVSNNGKTELFTSDCIAYRNTVEIQSRASSRQKMVTIVEQDNGKKGTIDANNREYGGFVQPNGKVVESEPGPVRNLQNATFAFITIKDVPWGASTFHSHPSGNIHEDSSQNNSTGSSSVTFGGTTKDSEYNNAPSYIYKDKEGNILKEGDVAKAKKIIEYVFARKNNTVYIYNENGILATIPHDYFVNFK